MRKAIHWAFGAALLLGGVAAAGAGAEPVQGVQGESACTGLAALAAAAERAGAVVMHDLRGDDARAWLAAYNAIPPVTAIAGDQVVLVDRAGAPTMLVAVLSDGCITGLWEEGRALVGRVTDRVVPGV